MKKLFSIFIFLSIVSLTGAKEFNGIPIPKGVKTEYDKLENQTRFTTMPNPLITGNMGDHFKAQLYIDIVSDNNIYIYPVIKWVWNSWLFIESSKIYIDNNDGNIQSIELDWLTPQRTVITSKIVSESSILNSDDLIPFLTKHLTYKSKVTIRYSGNSSDDRKLNKKDIKNIVNMIEFYNSLIQQQATK